MPEHLVVTSCSERSHADKMLDPHNVCVNPKPTRIERGARKEFKMKNVTLKILVITAGTIMFTTSVQAACTGSNGRGWASGSGAGNFEMSTSDRTCSIPFPNFIVGDRRTPASEVVLTTAPRNGTIGVAAGRGLVYTPNAGFTGADRFCTRNTASAFQGQTLSGCITVTVR
jgi:hypothetical protein